MDDLDALGPIYTASPMREDDDIAPVRASNLTLPDLAETRGLHTNASVSNSGAKDGVSTVESIPPDVSGGVEDGADHGV